MTHVQRMTKLGWRLISTGGGCEAYMKGQSLGIQMMITTQYGRDIPKLRSDNACIGFYPDMQEGSPALFEVNCKFGDILDGKVKMWIPSIPEEDKLRRQNI